jgi:uncharacterized protein
MTFTGVILNALGVLFAGLLGSWIKRGIPERMKEPLLHALGLCVLYVGVTGFSAKTNVTVLVFSIAFGVLVGEWLNIEGHLNQLGGALQRVLPFHDEHLTESFVSSSIFICVGAMSIVGGIESGTQGTYQIYQAKAFIDILIIFLFATTKGVGCALASVSVFLYEAAITLMAHGIAGIVNDTVLSQMSEIGSLLIAGIGLNLLDITKLRIGNFVLAPFLPVAIYAAQKGFQALTAAGAQ